MSILNYTTTINTEKTTSEIQKMLSMAKAQQILCEYDDDCVMTAMSFMLSTKFGIVHFRLPANLEGVFKRLCADCKVPKRLKTREQAARVAWRIVKDWTEAQLAFIDAGMAEMTEVFLPYAQNKEGRTVYEVAAEGGLKMIAMGG